MVYIFNELSLSQISSVELAQQILEAFIKTTIKAKEYGFTEIRLHERIGNIYQFNLLHNYRVDDWLKDVSINYDLKDKFREIIATTPLLKDDEVEEKLYFDSSEFSMNLNNQKTIAFGLGVAHIYGTLCISLSTHINWQQHLISVNHYSLNYDGIENSSEINVRNFSSSETLNLHKGWVDKEQSESIEKSKDLWDKRMVYYPKLLLGTEVENQLTKIGLTKKLFVINDVLRKLNDFVTSWTSDNFNLGNLSKHTFLDISHESDCTMKKFGYQRKFTDVNGVKQLFDLHIKIPDFRIYILPNNENRTITVGYIGKHLKTCNFQ